ncbi:hypothetical protein CUMW_003810 [Citrus unshiu]|nr:hypothetical protein CUMW_003810 [Citrus unshiu]
MAKSFQNRHYSLFLVLSVSLTLLTITKAKTNNFSRTLTPSSLGLKREKLSHLHFYFHDIVGGPNTTTVRVAQAAMTNTSSTFFGAVVMMDDPLTIHPELSSKLVGRAQGIYASASLSELGFLMVMNFAFTEGKYNGSTLSVLGRNTPLSTRCRSSAAAGFSDLLAAMLRLELTRLILRSPLLNIISSHSHFLNPISGKNPTAVRVAQAAMTNHSPTLFGVVVMIDDPLTMEPEPSSKLVGRAQGIYASASQNETGLLMVMNFSFMEGKYNGSTLSVLGRNAVLSTVREMPIVGGSGLFRFARGYAQAKTHTFDPKTGDAVVEYNLSKQKLSHLHFYLHDKVSGQNATAVRVAQAAMTNHSPTSFGAVIMFDDALTMEPERNSKLVGRAQGMYGSASQTETGLAVVMNFAFMEGKYNGSTLSVMGRNAVFSTVREMPIIGGSGLFRFARGYVQAKTHTIDLKTGDAVVEYNVYVFHY